jgi:glycosyltransferase involved in cell wall biosynthesis
MTRLRVAITAPDLLSSGYSGMGLRALGIAQALGKNHDVAVLAAGTPPYLPAADIHIAVGDKAHRRELAAADVVITSNAVRIRQLVQLRAAVISDLYDPSYFEWLVLPSPARVDRLSWVRRQVTALRRAIALSDAILCANERQRDLYLGIILATQRLSSLLGQDEQEIERRVIVLPSGISQSETLPPRTEARARLNFAPDDVVFVWGGGVWDWMDAETVLRASLAAHERDSRIRLVFLGIRRGDETDPRAARAAKLLAPYVRADTASGPVRVNERWVGPEQRLDYLAAADAGILGQLGTLETHFSFRTRLVDCLAAGLPVVSMRGDELSEQAAQQGWGLISNPRDAEAMTANLLRLASDEALRAALQKRAAEVAAESSWENACQSLNEALPHISPPSFVQRAQRSARLLPAATHALYTYGRRRFLRSRLE